MMRTARPGVGEEQAEASEDGLGLLKSFGAGPAEGLVVGGRVEALADLFLAGGREMAGFVGVGVEPLDCVHVHGAVGLDGDGPVREGVVVDDLGRGGQEVLVGSVCCDVLAEAVEGGHGDGRGEGA
jgi:hypothetical protein